MGGAEPGARDAAQRADRPAPAVRVRAQRAGRLQAASRTRSAARSTTSCSPSSPARCATGCARAACAPRALELRALVPVSIRAEDEHHQLGNRIAAMRGPLPVYVEDPVARLARRARGDGRAEGLQAGGRRRGARRRAELRAADGARAGVADQLLHAPVQPDRDQRARARSSRSTCSGASCRTCSRSRSCRATTRWRSRSCPTTAGSTSGCSATTTRCPTSTSSAATSRSRSRSSWWPPRSRRKGAAEARKRAPANGRRAAQ